MDSAAHHHEFKIILGSSSVARRNILSDMGFDFTTMSTDIDEKAIRKEKAEYLVMTLVEAKADAIIGKLKNTGNQEDTKPTVVICADTVENAEPKLYGKEDAEPTQLITCDQLIYMKPSWLRVKAFSRITKNIKYKHARVLYKVRLPQADLVDFVHSIGGFNRFHLFSAFRISSLIAVHSLDGQPIYKCCLFCGLEQQRDRRSQNVYPHHLSHKGYAKYAQENPSLMSDDRENNQAKLWVEGRKSKDGQHEGDDLKEKVAKIFGVPVNVGEHWILTIIDPYSEDVSILDPLHKSIRDATWKQVDDTALKMFNAEKQKKKKKRKKDAQMVRNQGS